MMRRAEKGDKVSQPSSPAKGAYGAAKMAEQSVHPLFRDKPAPDAKLWRYLSFAKFASLLDTGHLHFTRVDRFDDHFEGAWPQQDVGKWQERRGVFDVVAFTDRGRVTVAASCWFESNHESAAMWRIYAPGNEGVAIVASFQKLEEVMGSRAPAPDYFAGAGRVRYIDHFNEGLLDDGPQNTLMPYMLKNVSYAHEHEVRALINGNMTQELPAGGVDLPIEPRNFINEIIITPFSQPWFEKAVQGVADRYGLSDRIKTSTLSPINFYMKR